jgi:hypothetical protein
MSTYLVVDDETGRVLNAIVHDGTSEFPFVGLTLYLWDEEVRPWIGWTKTETGWQPPVPMPDEGDWYWDEDTVSWVEVEVPAE